MSATREATAPPSSRRAQQASATRRRLLDAAARLFATHGYAATSVAAIGEAVGRSRGLVNFHFTTKQKLLHAVIEDLVSDLESHMFPPDPGVSSPFELLGVLIDAHRGFVTEQPERARLLFRLQAEELDPSHRLDAFAQLHERWLERTRPWWDAALAAGELDRSLDHNAVATVVIGALRGIALEWLLAPSAVEVERAYSHLWQMLERGLTPQMTPGPAAG